MTISTKGAEWGQFRESYVYRVGKGPYILTSRLYPLAWILVADG